MNPFQEPPAWDRFLRDCLTEDAPRPLLDLHTITVHETGRSLQRLRSVSDVVRYDPSRSHVQLDFWRLRWSFHCAPAETPDGAVVNAALGLVFAQGISLDALLAAAATD